MATDTLLIKLETAGGEKVKAALSEINQDLKTVGQQAQQTTSELVVMQRALVDVTANLANMQKTLVTLAADGISQVTKNLKSSVVEIGGAVGDELAKAISYGIKNGVADAKGAIESLSPAIEGVKNDVIQASAEVGASFDNVGNQANNAKSAIQGLGTAASQEMLTAAQGAGEALESLTPAINGVKSELVQASQEISTGFVQASNDIGAGLGYVAKQADAAKSNVQGLGKAVGEEVAVAAEMADEALQSLAPAIDGARTELVKATQDIKSGLAEVGNQAGEVFSGLSDSLRDDIRSIAPAIDEVSVEFAEAAQRGQAAVESFMEKLNSGDGEGIAKVFDEIESNMMEVGNLAEVIAHNFAGQLGKEFAALSPYISNVSKELSMAVGQGAEVLKSIKSSIDLESIGESLVSGVFKGIDKNIQDIGAELEKVFSRIASKMGGVFGLISGLASGGIGDIAKNTLGSLVDDAMGSLKDSAVSNIKDAISEVSPLIGKVSSELEGATNKGMGLMNALSSGATKGISDVMSGVNEFTDNVVGVKDKLSSIFSSKKDNSDESSGGQDTSQAMQDEEQRYLDEQIRIEEKSLYEQETEANKNIALEEAALAHEERMNEIVASGTEEKNNVVTEGNEAQVDQAKESSQSNMDIASDLFGSMAQVAKVGGKKTFKAWKAMSRAQVVISTISAAQKAFESQIIPGDPSSLARGIGAAAIAIAAGKKRLDAINQTSMESGSESASAGGSGDTGAVGSGGGGEAPSTPATSGSGSSVNDQPSRDGAATIMVNGNMTADFISERLVPAISQAVEDFDLTIITPGSRNAQDLMSASNGGA